VADDAKKQANLILVLTAILRQHGNQMIVAEEDMVSARAFTGSISVEPIAGRGLMVVQLKDSLLKLV
jgi:hypothetical protein